MSLPLLLLLFLPPLLRATDPINYLENSLAKVCRPLDKNLDLMFLLDGSGSVSGNTFDTQIRMVRRVMDKIEVGQNKTRVAVLQYSGYTKTEIKFGQAHSNMELLEKLKGIRHISGTTRTGKALRRARNNFAKSQGARPHDPSVAQVVVVVGDGHSLDNPIPASREMREKGITLLTMGIGNYVNMDELIQMTEDPKLAFNNETMDEFITAFRGIVAGQVCDYAKGTDGAEILCNPDHIRINIDTQQDFHGHLYVPDHFKNSACSLHRGNVGARSLSLQIPLDDCGVQEQFLFSPRGLLAVTSVRLQFHPDYNHPKDETFSIRCFYPDRRYHGKDGAQPKPLPHFDSASLQLQGDPLIAPHPVPKMEMPCAYTIRSESASCVLEDAGVGDSIVHQWECDRSIIGEDYGFSIHSCSMRDADGRDMAVLDAEGCPLDSELLSEIAYDEESLRATAKGRFVNFADAAGVKFACSIRFCNRAEGECEAYVPAACGKSDPEAIARRRRRRQVNASKAMKEMADFMPPEMVERLFMRRAKEAKATNSSEEGHPVDSRGRPILQTFSARTKTRRLGVPSIRSFRPISELGGSARSRQAINIRPLKVTPKPKTTTASQPLSSASSSSSSSALPSTLTTEALTETSSARISTTETIIEATSTVASVTTEEAVAVNLTAKSEANATALIEEAILALEEEPQLPASTTALPEPIAALKEAAAEEEVVEEAETEKTKKMPLMAGSVEMPEKLSFEELVGQAIANASEEAAALEGEETLDLPPAKSSEASQSLEEEEALEETEGSADGEVPEVLEKSASKEEIAEETQLHSKTEEEILKALEEIAPEEEIEEVLEELDTKEEEKEATDEAVEATTPVIAAAETEQGSTAASVTEEAEELAVVKITEEAAAVDSMKEAMGMELVGLAVDIVAGLQLGQVQIESQTVRVRPAPSEQPSPFNFCPRPSF